MIEKLETEQSMFVQTTQGITSDGTTLTLNEVTPSTLHFSDRPQRIVGHMATADFVELWAEGDNSFQEDPPNAVLAFLEPGADVPEDAVVVIQGPRLEDSDLTYSITPLDGGSHAGKARYALHPASRRRNAGGRGPRTATWSLGGGSVVCFGVRRRWRRSEGIIPFG